MRTKQPEIPTLTSRKLVLKPWENTPEMMGQYVEILEQDEVARYLLGSRVDRQRAEAFFSRMFTLIPGTFYHWSVWREGQLAGHVEIGANDRQFAGDFELRGFALPTARGNHTAEEAIRAVLQFAFKSLRLERVRAVASFENMNAAIALHKVGFKPKVELIENQILWVWTAVR